MIKQKKTARAGQRFTVQTNFGNTVSLSMWLGDTDELAIRGLGWRNTPPCAITFTCAFDCDANHARSGHLRSSCCEKAHEHHRRVARCAVVLLHGNTPSCLRHYAASRTQSSIHAHEKPRRHRQQQRAEHWRTLKKHGKHNVALYWRLGDNAIDIRGEMCSNVRTTITVQARTANSMYDSDSKNVRNERRAMSSTVQENQDVSLVQTMQNNKLIGHGCPIQRLPCTDEWKCVHRRMQCHTSRRAILHRH